MYFNFCTGVFLVTFLLRSQKVKYSYSCLTLFPIKQKLNIMKHYVFLFFAIFFVSLFSQIALGAKVGITGKWGDDIIRTIFPKVPIIFVDGNVLSVYCADVLSGLTITVTDAEGNVILKECVTISSGETVNFTLDETVGAYQIYLNHEYGYLLGDFILS